MTDSEDEMRFDLLGDMKKKMHALHKRNKIVELQAPQLEQDNEYYLEELLSDSSKANKKSTNLGKSASRKNNMKVFKKNETKETIIPTVVEPTQIENINEVPPRPLTPLSKLLVEEKQRKTKQQSEQPVARRLRSSIGKQRAPEQIANSQENNNTEPAIVPSPPKRRGRGRQAKQTNTNNTCNTIELPNAAEPSILDYFQSTDANNSRSRRNAFAEMAARAPVVGHIDLVSAVPVRVEGFVSLDSDDDEATNVDDEAVAQSTAPSTDLLDVSFDADNPEISIKIRWKGNYEKYLLRKFQKFEHIMQQIADRENVPVDDIVLNLNDKIIEAKDTPDSIGYKVYHFIDGRVMKVEKSFDKNRESRLVSNLDENKMKSFHLKVQSNTLKHPILMTINKTDKFKILYIKCAEEFKVEVSRIRLLLDGEKMLPSETPDSMGLDSGDVVDLQIK